MTTCVSGGACMSRSSLRLGASEVESDALLGKGSGSRCHWRSWRLKVTRAVGARCWRRRELAEQAVALERFDLYRQYLPDDVGRGQHMRRLQMGGAAGDLAGIAPGPFEQHIDGVANRSLIEGRLLAVDQFLKPHQSLVHFSR